MLILKHYTDVNIYSYLYEYEYIFHTHTYIYTTITYMLYIKICVQVNKCSPWLFSLCRLEYLSTQTYHLICLQLFSWMFWGQIRSFSAQVEVPSSTIPLWLAWVHPLQKKSRWKKNTSRQPIPIIQISELPAEIIFFFVFMIATTLASQAELWMRASSQTPKIHKYKAAKHYKWNNPTYTVCWGEFLLHSLSSAFEFFSHIRLHWSFCRHWAYNVVFFLATICCLPKTKHFS